MKRIVLGVCVLVLLFSVSVRAQVPGQPDPEHKKLEVWAGTWTFQGDAKDSPSGPTYKVNWTMHGEWLPGGFFLLINGSFKDTAGEMPWLEILGYDPVKKTHIGYVFWLQWGGTATYTMTFKDRTILTGGQGWRQAWEFSPDGMSLTGKREREQDGKWWTAFDVKGVKSPAEKTEAEMDMPEEAIQAAADKLASAISRLDDEGVTSLFSTTSGAKYISDGASIAQEELRKTFKKFYGGLQEMNFAFEKKEVRMLHPDVAVLTGWARYTAVAKDGQKADEKAIFTIVYVHEDDKWNIFQAHKSFNE